MQQVNFEITLRRATVADAAAVLHCLHAAFAPYREEYSLTAFADTVLTPETLLQRMKIMSILVAATDSGDIVGTVAYEVIHAREQANSKQAKKDGHIRGMAVLPDQQGRGVAELLLHAAESELRALSCWRIALDTTAPLERAIRFYEKNGFLRSGVVGDFFGMPLYEYVKELSGSSS